MRYSHWSPTTHCDIHIWRDFKNLEESQKVPKNSKGRENSLLKELQRSVPA